MSAKAGASGPLHPTPDRREEDVRIAIPDGSASVSASPGTRRRRIQANGTNGGDAGFLLPSLSHAVRDRHHRHKSRGDDGGCYVDSESDGENHDGKSKKMYNRACPIGQFFLNPCLFLSVRTGRCRSFLSRLRRGQWRKLIFGQGKERKKRPIDLAVAAVVALAIALLLWSVLLIPSRRRPFADADGRWPPVLIRSLEFSGYDDVGGWLTPYGFPPLSSLGPLSKGVDEDDNEGDDDGKPDYGGLEYESLQDATAEAFRRTINAGREERYEYDMNRRKGLGGKKKYSPRVRSEYAFDDDEVMDPVCRRNSWWMLYRPNCNVFHEVDLVRKFEEDVIAVTEEQTFESHYISHGYFRDVWLVENHSYESSDSEAMALKMLRWKHEFDYKKIETVRKDALVMERLTASPRIINMYGHCAFSVTVEAIEEEVEEFVVPGSGYAKEGELDDSEDVDIKNKYTVTEKVEMALAMAESIADLHGFKDGIIVHDDIQLCQWLRTKEGTLKLGDFNRAEIMLWDEEKQEYCKYNNGEGYGNYRSPEEFAAEDINEQIDVFSMGNNIYGLLTGLWVFYENEDDEVVQSKIIDGETAYVDERYRTRSYAEGRLVEIMERCWKKDPDERATIFEVVSFLRETLAEHKKREGLKQK